MAAAQLWRSGGSQGRDPTPPLTLELQVVRDGAICGATGRHAPLESALLAGVVQWQNGSFPSFIQGFDSPHPLQVEVQKGPERAFFVGFTGLETQLESGTVRCCPSESV